MNDSQKRARKPLIFKYYDPKDYLRDVLARFKEDKAGFSLRGLAKSVGVAPPYLTQILKNRRPLSEETAIALTKSLELTEDQSHYFMLLRTLSESSDSNERYQAFDEIQKIRAYRTMNPRESETYRYLRQWYYVAIREMARLPGFKLEPRWIQSHLAFPVSQSEITKAIHFLTKYNFLMEQDGNVEISERKIECLAEVFSLSLARLHRQIFQLADQAIDKIPRDERHMMGQMVAIPKTAVEDLKKILNDCASRISALEAAHSQADSIYSISLIGFPVARREA